MENWQKEKATNTLDFFGLDKFPGNPKYKKTLARDMRWRNRLEAWNLASKFHEAYQNQKINIDNIIIFVKQRGFWSIWFTIFKEPEVRKALIENFKGTARCFDANNGYVPIPRNNQDL